MASSIGGTIFKIFADNSHYKNGMLEAKNIRQKVSDAISAFDQKEAQSSAKINDLYNKRIEKQSQLDNAIKNGSSEKVIMRIRAELARLTQAEEKAVEQSIKLNTQRRESYKKLSEEISNVTNKSKESSFNFITNSSSK